MNFNQGPRALGCGEGGQAEFYDNHKQVSWIAHHSCHSTILIERKR